MSALHFPKKARKPRRVVVYSSARPPRSRSGRPDMLKRSTLAVLAAALLSAPHFAPAQPPARSEAKPATVTPADRNGESWWKQRHEHVLEENVKGEAELLFIGDSITQGWEDAGKQAWASTFDPRRAADPRFS